MLFLAKRLLLSILVFSALLIHASDLWDAPAFSADPDALRQAAAAIKPEKDTDGTIFLNERRFTFDASGKAVEIRHTIFRVENEEGVTSWARTEGQWDPWYQTKPQIKARVITPDGAVHLLDPKTLNDVPVHEDSSDMYSGQRAFGGPLPAIAPGVIVEEEVTIRETAPFFSGGTAQAISLAWSVPVHESRVVLVHPESLPLKYVLDLLPKATVNKSSADGMETITIEQGPLEAYTEQTPHVPSDVVLYPQIVFTTGSSWQQVAAEYDHRVKEKLRLADVEPLVARLNLAGNSNEVKINKIVAALHKNVRYTGIEFGESGLIPQYPAETLKRKYGDCKDKATLLVAMLAAAGIPAKLALLSTGPGLDVNQDLPGMGVFDHAIVYVPPTSAVPELWIDATAQYSRVGYLPHMDYGRWALIVDGGTTALKKTPELTAEQNLHVESREFLLSEYGPATIKEITEKVGPEEAGYREYYGKESKQVREETEKYVKNMYLADSLKSLQRSDPSDLEKPFVLTVIAEGRRGLTDLTNATAAIRTESLFDRLPKYFYTSEPTSKESGEEPKPKPKLRTVDWQIDPFITEWRYKIMAPAGFKLRALPANKDEQIASAHLIQKYKSDDAGNVEAILRFEVSKSRLTVAEAQALREAIVKASEAEPVLISFDQRGYALLSEGKVKEALASFQKLASQHPKEALHKVQMARVLLDAGLGERARATAKEATLLEPNSALAFSTLGWVMQHDLIGRRFKKGFDLEASVAAYRKAKKLDPKDKDVRANLAAVLEHDDTGTRYSSRAHLKEAIAEFKEMKKLDDEYGGSYDDNILYDLWYSGEFKELKEFVATLPSSDLRKSLLLAAVAVTDGKEAAIKKSLEITTQPDSRSRILVSAGYQLLRTGKYSDAADLMATASGQVAQQTAPLISLLRKTRPRGELKIDDTDPASVIQKVFVLFFSGAADKEKVSRLTSRSVLKHSDLNGGDQDFNSVSFGLRSQSESSGLSYEALADIVISSIRYSKEGDPNLGYKIALEFPGSKPMDAFVVHEEEQYKIVELAADSSKVPDSIGWEVLARLENNDLAGARHWLDWAREIVHLEKGDDPLSGQPFPHFWAKGQEADAAVIRTAALVLLASKELTGENFAALVHARDAAKTDEDRIQLNLAVARASSDQQRWAELLPAAEELLKAAPDSLVAFEFAASAYRGLKKFDDWEKLVQSRLQKHPGEPDYIRAHARLLEDLGEISAARDLIKGLIDRSKATDTDLNQYAWDALVLPGKIDQETIDAAQRANELTKNANFGILHTLACLYAEQGKTAEAREWLLKAMNAGKMEEPNSEIWFGFAKIAEQYGEPEAARAMYSRMEKPKVEHPNSSYTLAQQRLAQLRNSPASTAKNGGQQ